MTTTFETKTDYFNIQNDVNPSTDNERNDPLFLL